MDGWMGGWVDGVYISAAAAVAAVAATAAASSKQQAQSLCTMNIARICIRLLKKPSCKQKPREEEEEQAREIKEWGGKGIYEMNI